MASKGYKLDGASVQKIRQGLQKLRSMRPAQTGRRMKTREIYKTQLPVPQYQWEVLQAVSVNQLGAGPVRASDMIF